MYKLIKSKEIYNGFIKLAVDDIVVNNTEVSRVNLITPMASAIIVTDEEKNIYLVKQLRYAVKDELLEIPAGIIDQGENSFDAAVREANEELGYSVKDVKYLFEFFAMPGLADHIVYVYEAKIDVQTDQKLDYGEFVEVIKMPISQFLRLEIKDAKTLIAQQYLFNKYGRNEG